MSSSSTHRRVLVGSVGLLMLVLSSACIVDGDVVPEPDVWECATDDDCIDGFRCVEGRCDDGPVAPVFNCVDEDNDQFFVETNPGDCSAEVPLDCDDTNNAINPGATELCNGVDDDCDEAVDEDLAAIPCALDQGVCAGVTTTCVDGAPAACDYGTDYVAEEASGSCTDGLDNDCDGITDTDPECPSCMDGDPCSGVGCPGVPDAQCACAGSGTKVCSPFESCVDSSGTPIPVTFENPNETCDNGIDDNCNGQVDEGCP